MARARIDIGGRRVFSVWDAFFARNGFASFIKKRRRKKLITTCWSGEFLCLSPPPPPPPPLSPMTPQPMFIECGCSVGGSSSIPAQTSTKVEVGERRRHRWRHRWRRHRLRRTEKDHKQTQSIEEESRRRRRWRRRRVRRRGRRKRRWRRRRVRRKKEEEELDHKQKLEVLSHW